MQAPGQYMASEEELTLRQLVESFAAENDVQLLPKAGQLEEGLQVCTATSFLFVAQAALTQKPSACTSSALMPCSCALMLLFLLFRRVTLVCAGDGIMQAVPAGVCL